MKMKNWLTLACLAAGLMLGGVSFAAEPDAVWGRLLAQDDAPVERTPDVLPQSPEAAAPTEGDAALESPARKLVVTVRGVKGTVRVRETAEAPWARATVGMQLTEGAEVQTGLGGSQCLLHIEPQQAVVVDRATSFKVVTANFNPETQQVKTDLGMAYGRINYEVQAAGVDHDANVHTPGTTLSIRGTLTFIQDDPLFPPIAASYQGRVTNKPTGGPETTFGDPSENGEGEGGGEGDETDNDAAASLGLPGTNVPLLIQGGTGSPGQNMLPRTHNFSRNFGQTNSEVALNTDNLGGGFSPDTPSLTGGRDRRGLINRNPLRDQFIDNVSNLPFLLFTFSWMNNADLDSFVIDPLEQVLAPFGETFPGAVQQTPQGGLAGPDHLGPDGTEQIRWQGNAIPQGSYTYGLKYFSGEVDAPFKVDVIYRGPSGSPQVVDTFTGVLTPSNPEASRTINLPPNGSTAE